MTGKTFTYFCLPDIQFIRLKDNNFGISILKFEITQSMS